MEPTISGKEHHDRFADGGHGLNPLEQHNLADQGSVAEVEAALRRKLQAWPEETQARLLDECQDHQIYRRDCFAFDSISISERSRRF